jgi:peroxiredoxin
MRNGAGLALGIVVVLFMTGTVRPQEIGPPSDEVKAILSQAQELNAAGKLEEALGVLKKGRDQFPQSLHLTGATFQMLFGAGRFEECLDLINATFADTPEAFKKDVLQSKRNVLANLYLQSVDNQAYEKALSYLKEAADLGYKHPVHLYYLEAFQPLRRLSGFDDVLKKIEANAGVGRAPEDFTVSLMDGRPWTLSQQKGKVVLVYFWETFCLPCVKEFPTLRKIHDRFQSQGLEILSISLDEDRTKLENFLAINPLPWKQVFSGKGWNDALARQFEVDGTPYSFLVDKDGIMRAFDVRGEDIEKAAARLLNDGSL